MPRRRPSAADRAVPAATCPSLSTDADEREPLAVRRPARRGVAGARRSAAAAARRRAAGTAKSDGLVPIVPARSPSTRTKATVDPSGEICGSATHVNLSRSLLGDEPLALRAARRPRRRRGRRQTRRGLLHSRGYTINEYVGSRRDHRRRRALGSLGRHRRQTARSRLRRARAGRARQFDLPLPAADGVLHDARAARDRRAAVRLAVRQADACRGAEATTARSSTPTICRSPTRRRSSRSSARRRRGRWATRHRGAGARSFAVDTRRRAVCSAFAMRATS